MYIALGSGADSPQGIKERTYHFLFLLQVSKKISLKSDFIHFFLDLLHVYSPRAGGHTAPRRQSFDINTNFSSFRSSVASLNSF